MDFKVDKKRVNEGDIVEVTWSCPQAESAKITINNGFRSSTSEVEKEGTKKYKLNRSNGKTVISLETVVNGKSVTQTQKIHVKKVREKKQKNGQDGNGYRQTNGGNGQDGSRYRQGEKKYDSYENLSNHPFREKINSWKSRLKYFWQMQSPQKRQSYILISAICIIMIVAPFFPSIVYFGLCTIAFYLLWTIAKR